MKNIDNLEALKKERENISKKVSAYEDDIMRLHNKLYQLDVLCEKEKAVLGIQPVIESEKDDKAGPENYRGKVSELKNKIERLVLENERLKKEKHKEAAKEKLIEKEEEISALKNKVGKLVSEIEKLSERQRDVIETFEDIIQDLAGGISHKSRNSLATISGAVQLCQAKNKLDESVREQLNIIEENVDGMLITINEFLQITRKIEVYCESVDINSLIQVIVQNIKKNTANLNISFAVELENELPRINCSSKLLKQAMENIIQNSIESIVDEGRVEVKSWYDKKKFRVCVCIKDTGRGIPEQQISKVFQAYFTSKKGHKGNGLTVSRIILGVLGGSIALGSIKGKGTKINIYLPV